MVKDNHKELAKGLRNYLELLETEKPVIVEVHNVNELPILEDFRASEDFDIEIVMLDNFEPSDLKTVTLNLPDEWAAEVSGGITLDNVQAYCSTGVDRISVGAVTHSFDSLDLSLKVTPSR
jgi:nicotinate-nucleotide pyrophosphorylase (carboxylating)